MSLHRAVLLALAFLTFVQVADAKAEPTLAYVSAKNANPKRLDIFKKGLAELGYAEGKNIRMAARMKWRSSATARKHFICRCSTANHIIFYLNQAIKIYLS